MNTFELEKGHKMYCLELRHRDCEMAFNLGNLSPIHVQLLICHDIGLKQCKFVVAHDDGWVWLEDINRRSKFTPYNWGSLSQNEFLASGWVAQ